MSKTPSERSRIAVYGPPGAPRGSSRTDMDETAANGRRADLDYQSGSWAATGRLPDRPDDSEHISADQLDHLGRCLTDAPYLAADLDITATRQDRFPTRPTPSGDGSESPLPYRESARRAADQLSYSILSVASVTWHRVSHGQHNPFRSAIEAAGWLYSKLELIAQDPDAEQYARRISDAHAAALDGPIERPPEWRYLGTCPGCAGDLEAQSGAEFVTCSCGWRDQTSAVIDRALESAQDMLLTESQLIGALELDGKIVTRKQIQGWHTRGRLAGHQHKRATPAGHGRDAKISTVRTFRLSEVRAIVADLESRRRS